MQEHSHKQNRELLVLIHGLAANTMFLRPLERHFSRLGFNVLNWGYPSIRNGVEKNAQRLRQLLEDAESQSSNPRIHIVAHSMGSIVTRAALTAYLPAMLGRVVLLGPPNRGSPVARRLAPALGRLCPALHDLSDVPASLVNQLPVPENYSFGIIAAAYDRVVPLANTHLETESDHLVLPFGHGSMLFQAAVADAVHCFLTGGQFCPAFVGLA